ncbi:hypothetical protein EI77_02002 [Prosthecobacter fusiformis]|uniref:Uncharacterized protein n=1 Tax=Prosthecobacter fusiformis TaxID=48464 RepID=A0A4R7RY68_9BACT|nr:hypothetical protein [Prosthecobacter fusiformis]TDU70884.1 hypothetical protein EI77_02002 [Prosthecobacter fusiformis]
MNPLLFILSLFLLAGLNTVQAQAKPKPKAGGPSRAALFVGKGTAAWLPKTEMLPAADAIETQAQKLSTRLRNIDPFGLSTFPREDDAPVIEDDIYRETPKITLNQALQTLKINGVNLHRKEFLIGGRQASEGDVLELSFKGEVFQAQVIEVNSAELLFHDLQRDETGVLKHQVIPQLAIEPLQKIASQFESRMTPVEPVPPDKP